MKYPPRTGTMLSRVLARLLKGERLTHLSFQNETATYRLAVYIEILRNTYCWPIIGEERISTTSDPTGRKARYFVYFLPRTTLLYAGKGGLDYVEKVMRWEKRRIERKAATSPSASKSPLQSSFTQDHPSTSKKGDKPDGDE